jgi:hypothetical protein
MKNKRAPLTFNVQPVTPVPADEAQTGLAPKEETPKRKNQKTKTVRDRGQFIAAHVSPEAAKQFKLLAVQQDKMVTELVSEAINDLFAKNGLSRIA